MTTDKYCVTFARGGEGQEACHKTTKTGGAGKIEVTAGKVKKLLRGNIKLDKSITKMRGIVKLFCGEM